MGERYSPHIVYQQHVSQIPLDVLLGVGDVIDVEIRNVDVDRGRISLGWVEER